MKQYFVIILISVCFTSCSKENLFGQQFGNEITQIPLPRLLSVTPDGTSAIVFYNNNQITLNTSRDYAVKATGQILQGDFTATGFLSEPPTKPSQWDVSQNGNGYIANGSVFNNGMSADRALIWHVHGTWNPTTQSYDFGPNSLRAEQAKWMTIPTYANDYTAYIPGTQNIKSGWKGGPYSMGWGNVGYWTILN